MPEWTWERWQWRGTPHSQKLQHYWNLTIRLFSVKCRTLVGGVLPLCREEVGVFYSPMDEKILIILVNVHQRVLTCKEMFQDIKFRKFKVEGIFGENILGHPQGGNFEFKMIFYYRSKRVGEYRLILLKFSYPFICIFLSVSFFFFTIYLPDSFQFYILLKYISYSYIYIYIYM